MISHRNMIFSTWQVVPMYEEMAKVYTVSGSCQAQETKMFNFQIASHSDNPCSFGGSALVSCNGRSFLYLPAIHFP